MAALILIACGRGATTARSRAEPLADAGVVAVAAAAFDAAPARPIDPPADAAVPRGPRVEERGVGSCRVDADCVLSSYQTGCCTQACDGRAISVKELAARQAREDCAAFRASGAPCPPPAPCPVPTHRGVEARCVRRACTTILEELRR